MRFQLLFELENPVIPNDYRKNLLSWIKASLEAYDENLFLQLYHEKDPILKSYSWAPMLYLPKFREDHIENGSCKFKVIFSVYNYAYALHLYNAFCGFKQTKYPMHQNSMTLKQILIVPEPNIQSSNVIIKFLSPVISRKHDRQTGHDFYYSYLYPEEFKKYLTINLKTNLQKEGLDTSLADSFDIQEIEGKKVVMPVYEKKIQATLGTFSLNGEPELLNYMYKAGIGARKARRLPVYFNYNKERRKRWKNQLKLG